MKSQKAASPKDMTQIKRCTKANIRSGTTMKKVKNIATSNRISDRMASLLEVNPKVEY
jgi:hypothetical protein